MSNFFTESLDITSSGSRLLRLELPPESSSSRTGPGGEELSLSELSLSDYNAIMKQPFCLLAKNEPDLSTPKRDNSIPTQIASPANSRGEELSDSEDSRKVEQQASKNREDKLQSDIFILKKLNASFELFNQALHETGSANDVRSQINIYFQHVHSSSLCLACSRSARTDRYTTQQVHRHSVDVGRILPPYFR
jgi:hypothetical protein